MSVLAVSVTTYVILNIKCMCTVYVHVIYGQN